MVSGSIRATATRGVAYGRDVAASVSPDWLEALRDAIAPTGARGERGSNGARAARGSSSRRASSPGLFGGPLMSLVKAISARALADVLQQTLGVPVAPLFWAATDDADFDEAAVVSVALDGGARELRLQQHAPAGTPMARVPIGDDVHALAERLREAAGSAPHASYLDERARRPIAPARTVGDAYVMLLRQILEPLEIAVLDASHASVARAAAPLMLQRAGERRAAGSRGTPTGRCDRVPRVPAAGGGGARAVVSVFELRWVEAPSCRWLTRRRSAP